MPSSFTTVEWLKLQEIFETAASLPTKERDRYIEEACPSASALRLQIEAMLVVFDDGTNNTKVIGSAAAAAIPRKLPTAGERLGPYRILEIIGRGGMGIVYRAVRDDDQFRHEVAIKVASIGYLSPALRQRFLSERQILANLNHPNIARLLDGGTTPDDVPYVVIEFVDGKPIDDYCQEKALPLRQKIELMVQVASAVDYAHRHLVVHRDLKPDNIYVTPDGTPKLLDFGIAKALDPAAAGVSDGLTLDAARLMTREYASPEQVRGEAITTATDVYQIGILLYLLLTGREPFQKTKTSKSTVGELERMICEVPPPKPNVNHDLDQVILHALEKDPKRRYASAGDLADDLERYLGGFPVNARAASQMYRAQKFVLRNKLATGAVGTILLLLLLSTVVLKHQRDAAQANFRRAEQVSAFLRTVFSSADPDNHQGSPPTVQQLLDEGVASVDTSLASEPEARADLLTTFGNTYSSLGQYERADAILIRALALYNKLHQQHTAKYANCLVQDAEAASRHGAVGRSIAQAREAVAISTSVSGLYSEATAHALDTLGFVLNLADDTAEAVKINRQDIAVWEKIAGPVAPNLFAPINSLAALQADDYKDDEAEALYRRELNILGKDHSNDSETSDVLSRYGLLLDREGRYAEAEPILRQGLAMRINVYGPSHPLAGLNEASLGTVLLDQGRFSESQENLLAALDTHLKSVGPSHRYVASDQNLLGQLYEESGDLAKAESYYRQSLTLRIKLFNNDSAQAAAVMKNLGRLLTKRGQLREAEPLLQQALASQQRRYDEDHPQIAIVLIEIGRLQLAQHQDARAEATLHKALSDFRQKASDAQPAIATILELLGQGMLEEHRAADAKSLLAEAVTIREKTLPPTAPTRRNAEALLRKV